jgi:SAM-dependent methyltransferase
MSDFDAHAPDFGLTAEDYGQFRAGFPRQLADRLVEMGTIRSEDRMLDLGTGTGSLARLLAPHVRCVVGIDPAEALLEEARSLTPAANVSYELGVAEETRFAAESFDLVTAGQCWHWFDADRAAQEVQRVLAPSGRLVIAHFDWIPLPGNVVEATERLIREHNPNWGFGGGTGLYPRWLTDVGRAGFTGVQTLSFDLEVPYSHQAWVGRIRASAGVGASLREQQVIAFSSELAALLRDDYPDDPLLVPHRTWSLVAQRQR